MTDNKRKGTFSMPNEVWDDPFFHGSAERVGMYAYLLRNAAFKDHTRNMKGATVELKRGQVLVSEHYMAKACGVTRAKVHRFLSRMEADNRIIKGGCSVNKGRSKIEQATEQLTEQLGSLITICNYGVNPDLQSSTEQPSEQPTEQGGVVHRTEREEGIKKKGNKNIYPVAFEEFWDVYPRKEAKRHAFKAYNAAMKRTDHTVLLEATVAFAASWKDRLQSDPSAKRFVPHPATWLNGDNFNDWGANGGGDPLEVYLRSLPQEKQEQVTRLIEQRRKLHEASEARRAATARRERLDYTARPFVVDAQRLSEWVKGVPPLKYLRHALRGLTEPQRKSAPN